MEVLDGTSKDFASDADAATSERVAINQMDFCNAAHISQSLGNCAYAAYWLVGQCEVTMMHHAGRVVEYYDRLTDHVEGIRAALPASARPSSAEQTEAPDPGMTNTSEAL